MGTTTDKNHPDLTYGVDSAPTGQAKTYLVLSQEERDKGFIRPYRDSYRHVGIQPTGPTRTLTEDEHQRYDQFGYVLFEPNTDEDSPITGRYWTQAQLDARACMGTTTMGHQIAATYSRDPKFYGSTYCCHCCKHLPVGEFAWVEYDGSTGPRVGS